MKAFFRKIKNLWEWLPVIWNDAHWDYVFIERILSHKLKKVKEYHQKYGDGIDNDEIVKDLEEITQILDNRIEDTYFQSYSHLISDKKFEDMFEPYGEDSYKLRDDYQISDNMEEYERLQEIAETKRKTDYNRLHEIFSTYTRWWV